MTVAPVLSGSVAACLVGTWLAAAAGPSIAIYSHTTGGTATHVVSRGESLASIGSRFGVAPHVLARGNRLAPTARLTVGQSLTVVNLHIAPVRTDSPILINVPQRMLFLHREGEAPLGYAIAVGRPSWRTPNGSFQVLVKEEQPTWNVPVSIQREMRERGQRVITMMPPCPENPLGAYWLGLSLSGIGIHGTTAPTSIYRAVTHGCIRLHADDIRDLFPRVDVGEHGMVVYEPVLLAVRDGEILLEVHPDVYARGPRNPLAAVGEALELAGVRPRVDLQQVEDVVRRRDGVASVVGRLATQEGR